MSGPARLRSYSEDNEFRFGCPIFGVEVRATDCFAFEQITARGNRVAGREGCHACVSSSKCPIREMTHEVAADGDAYYSKDPIVGRLSSRVREAVGRVVVKASDLNRFAVPEDQRKAIELCDEKGAKHTVDLQTAIQPASKRGLTKQPRALQPSEPVEAPPVALDDAGGSYAAAINNALSAPRSAPVEVLIEPKPVEQIDAATMQQEPEPPVLEPLALSPPAPVEIPSPQSAPVPASPAARDQETKAARKPRAAASKPVPIAGLSMLEMARKMREQRK